MARTTVREHLLQLKEKGLLRRRRERQGRGRPSHRYEMTQRAKMLFPSRDGELMGRLIRFLQDHGATDLVETFFESYWESRTQAVKRKLRSAGSNDLGEQLRVLREILEEEGFMPVVDQGDETVTVRECNCPFPESVKQTRIPCRLEKQFFEDVFESELERVDYIPDGNPACVYEVARDKAGLSARSTD